jgi:N utilization substance protein A
MHLEEAKRGKSMSEPTLNLQNVIDQVSQEKGIDPKILVEAMEQAILTAAKRTFGAERELEARFNDETGFVDLFQYMTVVEEVDDDEREISAEDAKKVGLDAELGEELGFQIFYRDEDQDQARKQDKEFGDLLQLRQHRHGFGRIAAQTAKQVIIQRMRDAERERVHNEFKDRIGELISGTVRRFERGNNIIVDLGSNIEAILPAREGTPRESYRPGDRIIALLKKIDREARGPQIVLSRTDTGLLVKLFEQEVPEIYEGIVRIVAASREPGARSKIAVTSRDPDVDPVGACVGMKGSRVQAVVQELRGEKIDIVPWDRDPARFVCNAIAPAEVVRVVIDEAGASMELVVPDAKLSLAIGRRGQNVRLASQLSGWKLDIVSESRFKEMEEEAMAALARIPGVAEDAARDLYRAGFRRLDEVIDAPEEELAGIVGATHVAQLRKGSTEALEFVRKDRLAAALDLTEALTERQRMLLSRGINERVATALENAGYRTIEDVAKEVEIDRFAIRSGLGSQRANDVRDGAVAFLKEEWPNIAEAQKRAHEAWLKVREAEDAARRVALAEQAAAAAAAAEAESAATAEAMPAEEMSAEGAPAAAPAESEPTEATEA